MSAIFMILSTVSCYLIGSVPTAYVLVKLVKGVDIRTIGSGNVGSTNAGRALGGWAFALVLILDTLKGFLPVFFLLHYCANHNIPMFTVLLGSAALIIGHSFPIYLKFKGGKGVATSLGVFTALAPLSVLVSLGVFIFVVVFTRMISAGSICAAVAMGVTTTILSGWPGLIVFTWIICAFVIYNHRANIKRILSGTENRIKISR